jgi:hypothetical protein
MLMRTGALEGAVVDIIMVFVVDMVAVLAAGVLVRMSLSFWEQHLCGRSCSGGTLHRSPFTLHTGLRKRFERTKKNRHHLRLTVPR